MCVYPDNASVGVFSVPRHVSMLRTALPASCRELNILEGPGDGTHRLCSPNVSWAEASLGAGTYQRVIAAERKGKLSLFSMVAHNVGDGLADTRHQAGVLELANWGIILGVELFELVVPVELDLPSELSELLGEAGLYEVDGTFVHAGFGL